MKFKLILLTFLFIFISQPVFAQNYDHELAMASEKLDACYSS